MAELIGFAHKATQHEARQAFVAGATVIVTERPEGPEYAVYSTTTTNNCETISWAELAECVKTWRSRYPRQTFYVLD